MRLVHELPRERLLAGRRGVRVAVVLDDDDERTPLHGGEVDPLVERAGGRRAVADVHEAHAILAAHPEGERHARHHRNHVAAATATEADAIPIALSKGTI